MFSLAVWISSVYGIAATGGHHIIYIPIPLIIESVHLIWGVGLIYNYPNILVKISVAIMLLRVKRTKYWRIGLYSLIFSLVLVGVASTVMCLVMCRPISAFWSLTERETHCWTADQMATASMAWGGKVDHVAVL
jgi:hypothetical protein